VRPTSRCEVVWGERVRTRSARNQRRLPRSSSATSSDRHRRS
jgi:hypothetical protein